MKTLLRRLSTNFAGEDAGMAEAICAPRSQSLISRMADFGNASPHPGTGRYLGTLVNAEFFPPLVDDLIDGIWRPYAVAQHPLGRSWLQFHVRVQRLRAAWMANGGAWSKRALDVILSLALLISLSPLFLLIAALVWLEDGGPVFFAQKRVGQNGSEFKMYKIRSMCRDAEQRLRQLLDQNQHKEGVTFKLQDDPRITLGGKWLRKF